MRTGIRTDGVISAMGMKSAKKAKLYTTFVTARESDVNERAAHFFLQRVFPRCIAAASGERAKLASRDSKTINVEPINAIGPCTILSTEKHKSSISAHQFVMQRVIGDRTKVPCADVLASVERRN